MKEIWNIKNIYSSNIDDQLNSIFKNDYIINSLFNKDTGLFEIIKSRKLFGYLSYSSFIW